MYLAVACDVNDGVFFVLSFFPRGVLHEILNLIVSVSEGFSSYSSVVVPQLVTRLLHVFMSACYLSCGNTITCISSYSPFRFVWNRKK